MVFEAGISDLRVFLIFLPDSFSHLSYVCRVTSASVHDELVGRALVFAAKNRGKDENKTKSNYFRPRTGAPSA